MIYLYTQANGGPDLLQDAVRSHPGPLGVYVEGPPSPGVLDLARITGFLRSYLPEKGLALVDQRKVMWDFLNLSGDYNVTVVIGTHSVGGLHSVGKSYLTREARIACYDLRYGHEPAHYLVRLQS